MSTIGPEGLHGVDQFTNQKPEKTSSNWLSRQWSRISSNWDDSGTAGRGAMIVAAVVAVFTFPVTVPIAAIVLHLTEEHHPSKTKPPWNEVQIIDLLKADDGPKLEKHLNKTKNVDIDYKYPIQDKSIGDPGCYTTLLQKAVAPKFATHTEAPHQVIKVLLD